MAIEMLESVFLSLFTLTLIGCVAAKLPILYALIVGYLIFSVYARLRQYSVPAILKMSAAGIRTAKNVLMTFVLIGMLTALWHHPDDRLSRGRLHTSFGLPADVVPAQLSGFVPDRDGLWDSRDNGRHLYDYGAYHGGGPGLGRRSGPFRGLLR